MKKLLLLFVSLPALVGGVKADEAKDHWTWTGETNLVKNNEKVYIRNTNTGNFIQSANTTMVTIESGAAHSFTIKNNTGIKRGGDYRIQNTDKYLWWGADDYPIQMNGNASIWAFVTINAGLNFKKVDNTDSYQIVYDESGVYYLYESNNTLSKAKGSQTNDKWQLISPAQKTAYDNYVDAWDNANNYNNGTEKNLTQAVQDQLTAALGAATNYANATGENGNTAKLVKALEDAQKCTAAYNDKDSDASNKILNANGNYDPKYHWTVSEEQVALLNGAGNTGKDGEVGIYEIGHWGSTIDEVYSMSQTVTNLADGIYTLTVDCQASTDSEMAIFAGDKKINVVSGDANSWDTYTVCVEVTNGSLNIGAEAVAKGEYSWANADNFKLTKIADIVTRASAVEKYGTICLPYDFTAEGATILQVDKVEDSVIELSPVDSPKAGVPYMYQATAAAQNFPVADNAEVVTTPKTDTFLTGTFMETPVSTGNFLLQTQNGRQAFYTVNSEGLKCGAYKCYMNQGTNNTSRGVKAVYFNQEDATTAIEAIEALTNGSAQIFDVNGRKLDRLQKGVNIVNGKKIMVK